MSALRTGYPCHRFTSLLNYHLKCKICGDVLRDAMRFVCDNFKLHLFCNYCISKKIREFEQNGEHFVCPVDKCVIKDVQKVVSADKYTQSKVNELTIKCTFVNNGCTETLKVKDIGTHEKNCFYANDHLKKCGRCKRWFAQDDQNCFSCMKSVVERQFKIQAKSQDIKQRSVALNEAFGAPKKSNASQEQSDEEMPSTSSFSSISDSQIPCTEEISPEMDFKQKHKFNHSICTTCFGYLLEYVKYLEKKAAKILKKIEAYEEKAKSVQFAKAHAAGGKSEKYEVCEACSKWNLCDENTNIRDIWVSCDNCVKWFHLGCTRYKDSSFGPEDLDKFFFICDNCVAKQSEE